MELRGKTVLVIGLKRTGVSVARFVASHGGHVRVTDRQTPETLVSELSCLTDVPLDLYLGIPEPHPPTLLAGVDLVISSPGVPQTAPLLQVAVQHGIPVWSEIELASHFLRCPVLAVTGTNGKSTTTSLLGELLRESGVRVFVGGNLGTPLLNAVAGDYEAAVAEVSSFQLEWVERFRPQVGLLLNLTEDHLDRHGSFAAYGKAKRRMFTQQGTTDWMIVNRDDPALWCLAHGLRSRVLSFGWTPVAEGAWIEKETLRVRRGEQELCLALNRLQLQGRHNLENIMAAVSAALVWGVAAEVIQQVLETFSGLPHRLEFVATKYGVQYFDDSKGTNVGAVVQSLASFPGPVILLAGGVDKGGDYQPLQASVHAKVKKLVLFGQAREPIFAALGRETDTVVVDTLDEAVQAAAAAAFPGDTVLLSPACASFDQFRDYTHRGQVFRACVEAL